MNEKTELLIHDLINKSLDGTITPSEFEELSRLIKSDSQCADYYVSSIQIHYAFTKARRLFREHMGDTLSDSGVLLQKLAEYEKTAPVIPIEKVRIQAEPLPDAAPKAAVRRISKLPIITAIASCAALLLVFAYVYLNPQAAEVATLVDSIGAEWSDAESSMPVGARLLTEQKPMILSQGIIKVLYDNDVEVVLEGPAEFQIRSVKELSLKTGSLFTRVSDAGKGFTILTQHARIVDLGTEFGVSADTQNKTQLHVFKGKTTLKPLADKTAKTLGVLEGQAKEIEAAGVISDIQLNKEGFIRAMDSKTNLVWRGQKLDIADIISLGNGLGTGQPTGRIHPVHGFTDEELTVEIPTRGYLPLTKSPFINGIFVPNGAEEQVVSTRGDVFGQCPKTCGGYYTDVIANPRTNLFVTDVRKGTIEFGGQVYGDRSHPCVVFHANLGVTLDLDAVRAAYAGGTIARFVSKIGIADLQEAYPCNADFWVLVDGKVRYSAKNVREKGVLKDIAVEISPADRFLTLATTDGGDADARGPYNRAFTCDWCVFVEPTLEME